MPITAGTALLPLDEAQRRLLARAEPMDGETVALATADEESIIASVNAFVSRRVARRTTRMTSPSAAVTWVRRIEMATGWGWPLTTFSRR